MGYFVFTKQQRGPGHQPNDTYVVAYHSPCRLPDSLVARLDRCADDKHNTTTPFVYDLSTGELNDLIQVLLLLYHSVSISLDDLQSIYDKTFMRRTTNAIEIPRITIDAYPRTYFDCTNRLRSCPTLHEPVPIADSSSSVLVLAYINQWFGLEIGIPELQTVVDRQLGEFLTHLYLLRLHVHNVVRDNNTNSGGDNNDDHTIAAANFVHYYRHRLTLRGLLLYYILVGLHDRPAIQAWPNLCEKL